MIESKKDFKEYVRCDALASRRDRVKPRLLGDEVWKFQYLMRKREYEINTLHGVKKLFCLPMIVIDKYRFHRLSLLLNFTIPLNAVGPGFSIAHPGTIIINPEARIGKNCRIQTGVTIGSTNGSEKAPRIGDNVFLGDGCKLIGDITIADDVAIGANAVVVKSIDEPGTTWGGVPAKKISDNNSHSCLSPLIFNKG